MGSFLDKPKTEKHNESGSGAGLRYGLSSMQGWRIEMEDSHTSVLGVEQLGPSISWFAVFDGHAGSRVSFHSSHHLLNSILSTNKLKKACDIDSNHAQNQSSDEIVETWTDEIREEVEDGIRTGFLELDARTRTTLPEVVSGQDKSGSTATCCLITPKHVMFVNCGDSRGVMCGKNGKPLLATIDHKPSNDGERERILNAGGNVTVNRLNGVLAVSRGLGDYEYKSVDGLPPHQQLVSCVPEFYTYLRSSGGVGGGEGGTKGGVGVGGEEDEFVVLACDGIWDVMSNEDICQFISDRMKITDDLEAIADDVIDTCLHKGSKDNMSVVIIAFEGAPKICPNRVTQEDLLTQTIKNEITEIVQENDYKIELDSLITKLEIRIPSSDLPPGGGIHSKKKLIEDTYYTLIPGKKDEDDSTPDTPRNMLTSMLLGAAASIRSSTSPSLMSSTAESPFAQVAEAQESPQVGESTSNDGVCDLQTGDSEKGAEDKTD